MVRDWGMLACIECGELKDVEARRMHLVRCTACSRAYYRAAEHTAPTMDAPPLTERDELGGV